MSKITKRITAMLLSGMLVIGSVHGSVFAASTDVDPGQISEIAQEVYEEDTAEASAGAGEMAECEETSEDPVGAGETAEEVSWAEKVAAQYYTVTLDANGGYFENEWDDAIGDYAQQAEVVEKHIPIDGAVAAFPVLVDPDGLTMVFAGWSLERNGELVSFTGEEYVPVDDCVLYAVWEAAETEDADVADTEQGAEAGYEDGEAVEKTEYFNVVLDANGGYFLNEWDDDLGGYVENARILNKIIPSKGTIVSFPVYEADGVTASFLGWSVERDGELISQEYEEYAPVESCVLYALWEIEEDNTDENTEELENLEESDDPEIVTDEEQITGSNTYNERNREVNSDKNDKPSKEGETSDGERTEVDDKEPQRETESKKDDPVTANDKRSSEVPSEKSGDLRDGSVAKESDDGQNIIDSGECGVNDDEIVTWTLTGTEDALTLTISGNGSMADFGDTLPPPWQSRRSKIEIIIIEEGVNTIGDNAFLYATNLFSVSLPDNLQSIGKSSFFSCEKLSSVQLPSSLKTIGESSFSYCTSLSSVQIPNSVKELGMKAFYSCSSLTSVSLSQGLDKIEESAFQECSNLEYISFPPSIKVIEKKAFADCNDLSSISFNYGIQSIGEMAFYRSWRLRSISTPETLKEIKNNAFCMCYDVGSVSLSEGLEYIGDNALNFGSSNSIACKSISIPSTVNHIGFSALYGMCKYDVNENNGYYSSENGILYNKDKTILIKVPTVITGDFTVPDTVTIIEESAFGGCEKITGISLPNYLVEIRDSAFGSCIGLNSLNIPDTTTRVGSNAFSGCQNLSSIILGQSIQEIGSYCFQNCGAIESLQIPPTVMSLGNGAFSHCSRLKWINLEDTCISRIESFTFDGCSVLTNLSLPGSVEYIGYSAFSGTSIGYLTIPKMVNSIGTWNTYGGGDMGAFYGSPISTLSFESGMVEIPSHICNIGKVGTSTLRIIEIPVSVASIGEYAFNNCNSITDVYYAGSADEWDLITKKIGNQYLTKATIHFRSTLNGPLSNSNEDIISRVREYTADDLYAQYNAIIENTSFSGEEKFHKMNSLLCNYGFTDPKEGIRYISNVTDKRHAYLLLTTDDAYCANNYVNWLNSGLLAGPRRALLFADGLIFNNEINDWLSFTTYAESEYPGVKKYKTMLYDFMDATSQKTEIQSGIKFASDLASKSTGVAKIEAENIVNSLNACETVAEEREILLLAESEGIFTELAEARDENGNILLNYQLDESSGFGEFQKLMGYGTKTLSITNMAITDILDIIELDSKLATYSQYKRFLQEVIHDTSVPFQMRWAASLIIGELDEGYLGKIKDVAMDILGQTEFNSTIKKAVLNKIGASSLSGWLTVISIDSFFVNQITNIGDLVKNEAYVEGYNYLSKSYKNRLEESKAAFQQNPTEANAWEFYYNYNILYNLRHKGEEAYLKMSKIGGLAGKLFDFGYTDKKAVVDNTLKMLEERCQFTFDGAQNIPESCQFASKAVVKCPVDVEVVSSDGTVMATLIDGEESDFTNSYGRFAVVYDYYSQDYYKVICLNENNDFTLRAKGNNKGLVSVELARADDVDQDIYVINNIPIEPEEVLSASVEQITENSTITRYTADESEGTEEAVVVTNDNYVPVDSIALNQEELVLAPGESALLNVTFEPADSTKQGVFWNSTDPGVASVTDGRIEAVSEGSAIIYCTSQDNSDLIKTCAVTVANPVYPIENFTVEGLEDKVYTGEAVNQHITLKNAENTLTEGTDYDVSYSNNINAGTATVTITGKGNYTGTVSKTFTISAASITNATVSGIFNKTYTGSAITQNPTVKVGDKTLTKNTDYTVSYQNNLNVGTATVTITGKGNYTSKKTATFKINKAAQSITAKAGASRIAVGKTTTVSITGNKGKKSYKSSNTAIATVTSAGKVTAKKVGTVKITATSAATANYKAASKTVTIKVVPAATASLAAANQPTGIKLTWKRVTGANGYKVYRGSTLIKTITSGSTVSFVDKKANTNGTKYTYKVVAKATTGDSTLSKSRVIYRVSRPAVSSATNSAASKMTVKWGKNAKATGYQIQYSLSSSFASGNKAVTVASASTVSKVIGSLTKGKTYYVRIRTYKTVGSAKYWSEWSAKKSVKISK